MANRRTNLSDRVQHFLKQYGRRKDSRQSNDRRHDRKVEAMVKRMDPAELDRLIRQEDDP